MFHHPYRRECFRDRAISTVREFHTNKAKGDGPPLFNSENLLCWWVSAPHFMRGGGCLARYWIALGVFLLKVHLRSEGMLLLWIVI